MNKLKQIDKELLLVLFLILGPILDVSSYYKLPFNIVVRSIYLLILIILLLKNKENIKLLIILLVFSIVQLLFQVFYLNFSIVNSISNVLKFLYLPVSILYFSNFEFKRFNRNKILTIIIFLYIVIYTFSYITGIGSNVYIKKVGKRGFKGVFTSINEFSAILAGLLPIVSVYLKNNKKNILLILLFIGVLFCSLLIGTKVLLGGIILTILYLLYLDRNKLFIERTKLQKILIILLAVVTLIMTIFIVSKTRTYQNMLVQQKFFKVKNVLSYDFLNYVVFNNRLTFLNMNFNLYSKTNILGYLLGIGINTYQVKMVEIDLFDILFRYGIIGLIVFLYPLIKINYKKLTSEEKLALIIFILISLTSGHVLFYPSVCIYIGLILSESGDKKNGKTKR